MAGGHFLHLYIHPVSQLSSSMYWLFVHFYRVQRLLDYKAQARLMAYIIRMLEKPSAGLKRKKNPCILLIKVSSVLIGHGRYLLFFFAMNTKQQQLDKWWVDRDNNSIYFRTEWERNRHMEKWWTVVQRRRLLVRPCLGVVKGSKFWTRKSNDRVLKKPGSNLIHI